MKLWISYLLIWWFSQELFLVPCVSCVSINSSVLAGSRLSRYQEPVGFDLPNCCWHDEGKDCGGNSQDTQHQEWPHSRGRGGDPEREPMDIWLRRMSRVRTNGQLSKELGS